LPDGDYFGHMPREIDARHFRWCNSAEPDFLDPARSSSVPSSALVTAMFDGLTTYRLDGLPAASLATDWVTSDDLRTFTFHLRHDARWSNGRAVTAYDVAYAIFRVANRITASPNADNINVLKNVTAYLTRKIAVLRRDVAPYRAGDVVEWVAEVADVDVNARTGSQPLALRDLGAPVSAAYARVPARAEVSLIELTGERATPPSPDGQVWAYVYDPHPTGGGVYGWVPAGELDGEPNAAVTLRVRRVTAKNQPGNFAPDDVLAADERAERPIVTVHARDLIASTDVLGVRVPDPYTIVFECADPTPFFVALTDDRAMRPTPIEAVSRWPEHWTDADHVVTSGPMHLVDWIERDRVELARSPTYWDQADIHVDRITAYTLDDQAANTNFYFTAGCDATNSNTIPSTYLPAINGELRGKPYKDFRISPYFAVYFAWINTKKLSNRHLRRALALAIDRAPIPTFIHGNELPTAQLTPGTPIGELSDANLAACRVTRTTPGYALVMIDGSLCYVPPPGLDYDLAKAKAELALARGELGAAFPAKINYRYNAGSEGHKQIAEYLQASWHKLGVDVEIEAEEWNSLLADTREGKYDIARLGNAGNVLDTETDFLSLLRCATPDNRGRYCNPAYEALMDEARTMRDRGARNAKLRDAEAVMLEDAPLLPMYVYTQKHLIKPYVSDYALNLIDRPTLWRVRLDPAWQPPGSP
jgi:ABC-type oligopeptide transport system substrate-binding subunit